MRKISGMLNLEKARMQLRVLLSGPVPAITPMSHAVAIKVVPDAPDASERRVAELEQACAAAGIRIKGTSEMKLKMQAMDGPVIIESSDVTQFYPDHESGGELTAVEYLADGEESPRG